MLLFKVQVQTDEDLQQGDIATELEIAMMEVFASSKGNNRDRVMLYAPQPTPVVYMIPCRDILGKLPVVPLGDTGTFNADMPAAWFGADAKRDAPGRPGSGSAVWLINTWALQWAKDPKTDPSDHHSPEEDIEDSESD